MRNKKIIEDNEELYNNICDSVAHINVADIQSVGKERKNNIHNEYEDYEEENIITQLIETRSYSSYEHDNDETLTVCNISVTNTDHND